MHGGVNTLSFWTAARLISGLLPVSGARHSLDVKSIVATPDSNSLPPTDLPFSAQRA